jgi:lipopolysaccharide export system permease protein
MSVLDRYILRQLIAGLLVVTLGLAALIWLTQSLRFLELVVNRGLSLRVFFELTGLLVPNLIAVILPISTFVVVLFVYQRLQGDRELTVMGAAGLSPLRLARPALIVAALAIGINFLLNLWLVPLSYAVFRDYQFELRNRLAAFLLQDGVFTAISDDLTVYLRSREHDGTLRGILIHDSREAGNPSTIMAEEGRLLLSGASPRVMLLNGARQQVDRATGRLNVLTFAENTIDLARTTRAEAQRFRDSRERSIGELLNPDPAEISNPRDVPKFRVEAHQRLAGPLTTLGFVLVALAAMLGGDFRRHGGSARPLLAIGAVVGLVAAALALGTAASRQNALIPLITLAPAVVAGWFAFRPPPRLPALAQAA